MAVTNATKENDVDNVISMFVVLKTGVSDDEEYYMGINKDVGRGQEAMLSNIADKF